MLKKSLALLLCLFLFVPTTAFAEELDLSQLDYESLIALKASVEAELRSRFEVSPFELSEGTYTVGTDLKPGRYWIAASAPSEYSTQVVVFSSIEAYEQAENLLPAIYRGSFYVGEQAQSVELFENNFVIITGTTVKLSIFEFAESDYYTYTLPEGTYVPAGTYLVGEDIPSGTYRVYPATFNDGYIRIYDTSAKGELLDIENIRLTTSCTYETFVLSDGNFVKLETDAIFKKQPKLNFD